jgi:hypothetical protein
VNLQHNVYMPSAGTHKMSTRVCSPTFVVSVPFQRFRLSVEFFDLTAINSETFDYIGNL